MALILAQVGTSLYKVDTSTGAATALTLPSGVTLSTVWRPRFAILNQFVVMVNSPTRNISIDPEGTVRVLVPRAPTSPPAVAASGTGLTGAYQIKQSFVVKDSLGNLIMESALSPASLEFTAANQGLSITNIATSEDSITARRLYRNTAGGSLFYFLQDVEGNTTTAVVNALSDAGLALLPQAGTLGSPPGTLPSSRLRNIVSWKNRLWGTGDNPDEVDSVTYTEDGLVYAWPNQLTAYPKGQDSEGIVAFAPRRDQLGLLKRNGVWQITGSSNSNFAVVQLNVEQGRGGCIAPESVLIINDRAYWLGKDGVYEWGPDGVKCISDEKVAPWFKTGTYFNRSRFVNAFCRYNSLTSSYELHLAAAGASTENRWVSFNTISRAWYGPHKTDLFTPSAGATTEDTNGLPITVVAGTDGIIYTGNSSNYRDGSATAIDMDVYPPFHSANAPDIDHYWGELSILTKVESGGTLTITPTVGRLNSSAATAISHDLTLGRQRLRRIGTGALARLRLQQSTVNQGCTIYGYELPVHELGRR